MKNVGILNNGVLFDGVGNGEELILEMGGEDELRKGFVVFFRDVSEEVMMEEFWVDGGRRWLEVNGLVVGVVGKVSVSEGGMELKVIEDGFNLGMLE